MPYKSILMTIIAFALLGCERPEPEAQLDAGEPTEVAEAPGTGALIDAAIAGAHRAEGNRARDFWRNPKETLQFFGLQPEMTVIEIYPGGGWYTEILAPVLRDDGKLYAASFNPEGSEYRTRSLNAYREKLAAHPGVYGDVEVIIMESGDGMTLGEPGSSDMVVSFRNMHSLTNGGDIEHFFAAAYDVLKPGGVLGIVAHRAADDADPMETVESGYLPESFVIGHAVTAGFRLDARSEINANPSDTRDHPGGVWALPPGLRHGDEDRDRYMAIGESDRMTLRFVKGP